MSEAIVWIAYGEKANDMARASKASALEWSNLPQRVITHEIGAVSSKIASRYSKTTLLRQMGFDRMLYLDADTLVRQDISTPFAMLADGWDIVMAPSTNQGDDLMWHIQEAEREATLQALGYRPLALQCGVMWIARNERTERLFDAWHEEWLQYGDEDQAAFLRALARVPVKVWLLGHAWNGGAIIEHRFGACRS